MARRGYAEATVARVAAEAGLAPGLVYYHFKSKEDILVAADPGLPVEKDLERRDFRTNSMALRLKDGTLIDVWILGAAVL